MLVNAEYRLVERIAVGGMAEIYLGSAGEAGFERPVVIKKIHPRFSEDDRFVQMLINEAKITARLNHVNIVQILDLGRTSDGQHFIVMEFVRGKDLRDLIDRAENRDRPLPLPLVLYVLSEIAEALDYAHRLADEDGQPLGLIHRDVSPSNILVSVTGEVKLTDFGVARFGRDASQVGSLKGKLAYMAPEQARAEPLDLRSDIFALGAILYEILLGRRVFTGKSDIEMLHAVRAGMVVAPRELVPEIDPELEKLLLAAVAPEREMRFETAAELATALRTYLFDRLEADVGPRELAELLATLFDAKELDRAGRDRVAVDRRLGLATLEGFRDAEGKAVKPRFIDSTTKPETPTPELLAAAREAALDRLKTSPELSASDELALLRVISDIPAPFGENSEHTHGSSPPASRVASGEVVTDREPLYAELAPAPSDEDELPTEQLDDEPAVLDPYLASLPPLPEGIPPLVPSTTPPRPYTSADLALAFEEDQVTLDRARRTSDRDAAPAALEPAEEEEPPTVVNLMEPSFATIERPEDAPSFATIERPEQGARPRRPAVPTGPVLPTKDRERLLQTVEGEPSLQPADEEEPPTVVQLTEPQHLAPSGAPPATEDDEEQTSVAPPTATIVQTRARRPSAATPTIADPGPPAMLVEPDHDLDWGAPAALPTVAEPVVAPETGSSSLLWLVLLVLLLAAGAMGTLAYLVLRTPTAAPRPSAGATAQPRDAAVPLSTALEAGPSAPVGSDSDVER